MIPISVRRLSLLFLLLAGGTAQAGCITRWFGIGSEPGVEGSKGTISLTKLERHIDAFAERQVTLIAESCEAIKRRARDQDARRWAQHLKLANARAVYDIVTQREPLGRLADLYVLVELEYQVWAKGGAAERHFEGSGAERLIDAMEEARRGMSSVADLAMKPEVRHRFDELITSWRARNPNVEYVTHVRFADIPETAGKSVFESTSSFFDVINPLEDTSTSVERARELGERAFFYSKELPRLLEWQVEVSLEDTLAKPEIRKALSDVSRAVGSAEQMTATVRELPDRLAKERAEILAAWDARSKEVIGPVREIRSSIVEARELAAQVAEAGRAFERTFQALHSVTGTPRERDPAAPPGHPFDVREFGAAAAEIREMARESGGLLKAAKTFADHLFWRGVGLLALLFVLLLGYRIVASRSVRPPTGSPRNPEPHRPPTTWETRYGSPT